MVAVLVAVILYAVSVVVVGVFGDLRSVVVVLVNLFVVISFDDLIDKDNAYNTLLLTVLLLEPVVLIFIGI